MLVDADPGIQVNLWVGAAHSPAITATRLQHAAADALVLEDVSEEEKLQGNPLSSESAFLPFNALVQPHSAPDSGEEEFDDSLAPATSVQFHPCEKVVGTSVTCQSYGWNHSGHISHDDIQADINSDVMFEKHTQEDVDFSGTRKSAAVKIQSWWRGNWTRNNHPHAKEVRAEIRLRRMQDYIVHLNGELERYNPKKHQRKTFLILIY